MKRGLVVLLGAFMLMGFIPSASAWYSSQTCTVEENASGSKRVQVCVLINVHDSQHKIEPVIRFKELQGNSYQIWVSELWLSQAFCPGTCQLGFDDTNEWHNLYPTVGETSSPWWLGCDSILENSGDTEYIYARAYYKIKWSDSGPTQTIQSLIGDTHSNLC